MQYVLIVHEVEADHIGHFSQWSSRDSCTCKSWRAAFFRRNGYFLAERFVFGNANCVASKDST